MAIDIEASEHYLGVSKEFITTFGHLTDPIPTDLITAYQEFIDTLSPEGATQGGITYMSARGEIITINELELLAEMQQGTQMGRIWTEAILFHGSWQTMIPDQRQAAESNPELLLQIACQHWRRTAQRRREVFENKPGPLFNVTSKLSSAEP